MRRKALNEQRQHTRLLRPPRSQISVSYAALVIADHRRAAFCVISILIGLHMSAPASAVMPAKAA